MKCTAYFEENELITYDKYENAINKLSVVEGEGIRRNVTIRKANFGTFKECAENGENALFCIVMKNFQNNELYLEKRTIDNGMIFKSFIKISKKEADKILNGQMQWMKHSKSVLIHDFYLESMINKLELVSISETSKDVCTQIRGFDGIVFKHSIRNTRIDEYDGQFFDANLPMIDMINCDSVLYSYRRYIHIPQAVSNIVHIQSSPVSEVAYSL